MLLSFLWSLGIDHNFDINKGNGLHYIANNATYIYKRSLFRKVMN